MAASRFGIHVSNASRSNIEGRAPRKLTKALGATIARLHGRARHRAIGAKHAAIAEPGLQPFPTAFAIIEELAGIGRHGFGCLVTALRTGQRRFQPQRFARRILRKIDPLHGEDDRRGLRPNASHMPGTHRKKRLAAPRRPVFHGHSVQQQHRAGHHQRAADEHDRRPAAAGPIVAALGAAL